MTDMEALLQAYMSSTDPDATLREQVAAVIASSQALNPTGPTADKSLKLFLAGYAGAGNTGADVRVFEMIRQFQHIFQGRIDIALSVLDQRMPFECNPGVQIHELTYLPLFLAAQLAACDGVVACEGSMFKSNFSDAISLVMLGGLGLAQATGKLAVGYGAEAAKMSAELETFARQYCHDALIFCRNESSRKTVESLGLRATFATDTAWSFEPEYSSEAIHARLRELGWDGVAPLLGVCPVNPFWWPVRPDAAKYAAWQQDGSYAESHYGFFYFHNDSPEAISQYQTYLTALAGAVQAYCEETGAFPVIIGMDRVDRQACQDLAARLTISAPIFSSPEGSSSERVALLRRCDRLISSRFHAIVCAMPAGVPSIGVAHDERLVNLLGEGGFPELVLRVDDPALQSKLLDTLHQVDAKADAIAQAFSYLTALNLKRLGEMGIGFAEEVCRVYPAFPRPDLPTTWQAYLPPLSPHLQSLLALLPDGDGNL
jgi:polysaccharide pyruvyl transferase WcaK-like protein